MRADDIALAKQIFHFRGGLLARIGEDFHSEGFGKLAHPLANSPETDDTDSLTIQLDQRIVPIAEIGRAGPPASRTVCA